MKMEIVRGYEFRKWTILSARFPSLTTGLLDCFVRPQLPWNQANMNITPGHKSIHSSVTPACRTRLQVLPGRIPVLQGKGKNPKSPLTASRAEHDPSCIPSAGADTTDCTRAVLYRFIVWPPGWELSSPSPARSWCPAAGPCGARRSAPPCVPRERPCGWSRASRCAGGCLLRRDAPQAARGGSKTAM